MRFWQQSELEQIIVVQPLCCIVVNSNMLIMPVLQFEAVFHYMKKLMERLWKSKDETIHLMILYSLFYFLRYVHDLLFLGVIAILT